MKDHWRTELEKILEKNCTDMDDHDGHGDPRPLVDRCEKCRMMYAALGDLIKEVRDHTREGDIRQDVFGLLSNGAEQNRKLAGQLLDRADSMTAAAAKLYESQKEQKEKRT